MNKSVLALALFGAFAGVAHAQSSVVIYGDVDANVSKTTNTTVAVGKRDNNRLGFKGVEDLGDNLKALFQLEIRFESDTGVTENTSRPLFQGQSRVGLQGAFGTARLGRGLTAFQESVIAFEPWSGLLSPAGFQTDIQVAGYSSDPLSPAGNSKNRFSNAFFYNTPVVGGFQANATIATKEANGNALIAATSNTYQGITEGFAANSEAVVTPYSLSATYTNGPFAGMAAYERNAIETKLWSIAASFNPIPDLKLMASYQHQDQGSNVTANPDTKAWLLGANYTMGPSKFLAGYGQKTPDGVVKSKQISVGYEYSLSKRTYVYVDASNKKAPVAPITAASDAASVNYLDVGIHHNF
ncbi:MAG TPA: porin [Janthinobacterium sp.]|nr:porin [Janthinobacterium sp.]